MALWKKNVLLLLAVAVICAVPLFLIRDAEFLGADDHAEGLIAEISPDYEPWFEPVTEPSSGEMETFLFALQAGIGGCIAGFAIGRITAKRAREPGADNAVN